MKKRLLRVLFFFCAISAIAVVVFFAVNQKTFSKNQKQGFNPVGFVADQEQLLGQLEGQCSAPAALPGERCVDWVLASWAWTSRPPEALLRQLEASCAAGSSLSCERLRRVESVQRDNLWSRTGAIVSSDSDIWPRKIAAVEALQTMSDWHETALHGALALDGQGGDLLCGGVQELSETLVCVAMGNQELNGALSRVVTYIEQGQKILSHKEHLKNPLLRYWQGHNLRRSDFDSVVSLLRSAGEVSPSEDRLWNWLEARPWKYFLAFNAHSVFTGVPSHEFLHGLYFQSDAFREVVEDGLSLHWKNLLRVRSLVTAIFDTKDKYVLRNEIQAYLLQHQSPFIDSKSEEVRQQLMRVVRERVEKFDLEKFMAGY